MTHDTPPKRIWVIEYPGEAVPRSGEWVAEQSDAPEGANSYTLTSEAEAMVAAALREAAAHGDAWIAVFGDVEIKHTPANAYAADAVLDYQDAILALIPQPASAALDKLIAEAEARGRKITGVLDRDGRMICVGDHIRVRLEDKWTKEEYWHPEYEVIFQAPNFTLKHIGGGKDSSTARFYFNVPQPNSTKAIETILVAKGDQT